MIIGQTISAPKETLWITASREEGESLVVDDEEGG